MNTNGWMEYEGPKRSRKSSSSVEIKSFHQAAGPVFVIGQIFGIMPIDGVMGKDIDCLKFRWTSLRTIYSIFFLTSGSIEAGMVVVRLVRMGLSVNYAGGILFFVSSMARAIMLFQMARKWKTIMEVWTKCEQVFLKPPYKELKGWSLSMRIRVIGIFIILMSCTEHFMYMSTSMYENYLKLTYCNDATYPDDFFKNYIATNRPHLLHDIPYSAWELPLYECVNVLLTFTWNFVDLFIILISIALCTRFNQLSARIIQARGKYLKANFWKEIRIHYFMLCDLVDEVDQHISIMIFLTTGHNLLAICVRIFETFVGDGLFHLIDKINFWYSSGFFLCRSLIVLFFAASVNDSAKAPRELLRAAPTKKWGTDLQRMNDSLRFESVGLSGKRFFYISKGLILAIAGTVVKYELVLLDQVDNAGKGIDICIHLNR
ncbi:unnamed protein product [Diamesa tonsa]